MTMTVKARTAIGPLQGPGWQPAGWRRRLTKLTPIGLGILASIYERDRKGRTCYWTIARTRMVARLLTGGNLLRWHRLGSAYCVCLHMCPIGLLAVSLSWRWAWSWMYGAISKVSGGTWSQSNIAEIYSLIYCCDRLGNTITDIGQW